jgi:type VI secretion system protein ImpH
MAPQNRQQNSPVTLGEELFTNPHSFDFFRAVRLIEKFTPNKKPLGKALIPADEPVRFVTKPSIRFHPSDIAGLTRPGIRSVAKMDTPFLSILGTSGILPYWFTELAIARERKKDRAQTAFYNMFHHRQVSLFYLAWKKYRLAENYIPGDTGSVTGYLLSLIGLGTKGLTGRIGVPEESLIFCSGHLSRSIPSAMSIKDTVQYFSGTKVRINQFIERMLPLSEDDQTALGKRNSGLGVNMVCGARVWECQSKFRIVISPTTLKKFRRFLPSGDLLGPITASIKYLVGLEFEFDVKVELPGPEATECQLGSPTGKGSQLGWTSWLKSPDIPIQKTQSITFGHIVI